MDKKADKKVDKVRRTDRQKEELDFMHTLLENTVSCTVAVNTDENPLIHSTFFDFDKENNEIMFHFSKYGHGGNEMVNDKPISISVYKYGKLYTSERAVNFGGEYQSVIIYGKIRIVDEQEEKMNAMKRFFNKFFSHIPDTAYKEATVTEANPIHVVKVKIDKWFGKQHLVPETALSSFYSDFNPLIEEGEVVK